MRRQVHAAGPLPWLMALLASGYALAACGTGVGSAPGVTPPPAAPWTSSPPAPAPAQPAAAAPDDAMTIAALQPAGRSFPSRGHFVDGREAVILTNEIASQAFAARYHRGGLPVGSLLVQRHGEPRAAVPGSLFVMRQREKGYFAAGGDWEYAAIGEDGRVEQRGKLDACARCHAEAPSDWVFRGH